MHVPSGFFLDIVRNYLAALETPRSLTVALLIKYGEWDQVVSLTCDPLSYIDAERYFRDAAATNFLRKMDGLPTSFDLEDVALKAFSAAEKQCCQTNLRLSHFLFPGSLTTEQAALLPFVGGIRKDVTKLLGFLPNELDLKHGPGATFSDRGTAVSAIHKMTSRPTMTSSASLLIPLWGRTAWSRGLVESHPNRSAPRPVRGNRFTTVPKDATKKRGIAVEPSINVAYQLSVGKLIRRALRKWSIDLDLGQDRHRRLAADASRKGHLCTIDLSAASDTVSRRLVQLLLPGQWYALMETLRSSKTLVGGRWHHLEKFSSMGNGYTFELETLVFASIVRACARRRHVHLDSSNFGVYGDDIICPTELSRDVLSALAYFGFTPNGSKTFVDGPFRESCGGDYFGGFSVRPHFVKSEPRAPQEWMALANGIMRVQEQLAALGSRVSLFRAWEGCLNQLPTHIRTLFGPPELGDLVVNTTKESSWNVVTRSSIRYIRCYQPIGKVRGYGGFAPGPLLAAALYGMSADGFSLRGDVSGYSTRWVPFS